MVELQDKTLAFKGASLVVNSTLAKRDFFIRSDKIIAQSDYADSTIDCSGLILAPGFIDLQINGAFGYDFTNAPSTIEEVSKALPQFGITSFLATIISSPLSRYEEILNQYAHLKPQGAECLGLHLEGPHIRFSKRGAHNPEHIKEACDIAFWKKMLERGGVNMITFAPELPFASDFLSLLESYGICSACGHTETNVEQLKHAQKDGLKMVTHLFNTMNPLSARDPGPIGYVLGERLLFYSLIADGIHLHPEVVKLAWNAHPDGCILVSDASAALGMKNGQYRIGDQTIEVQDAITRVQHTNILAGGALPLNKMILLFKEVTGCSIAEAVDCVTVKPARLLGLDKRIGSLQEGLEATFVLFEQKTMEIVASYIRGRCVFAQPGTKFS